MILTSLHAWVAWGSDARSIAERAIPHIDKTGPASTHLPLETADYAVTLTAAAVAPLALETPVSADKLDPTAPGGPVDHTGSVSVTNLAIIDILPQLNDTGVVDLSNRLSQWRPSLQTAVTSPGGTPHEDPVQSTQLNPRRPELGVSPAGAARLRGGAQRRRRRSRACVPSSGTSAPSRAASRPQNAWCCRVAVRSGRTPWRHGRCRVERAAQQHGDRRR